MLRTMEPTATASKVGGGIQKDLTKKRDRKRYRNGKTRKITVSERVLVGITTKKRKKRNRVIIFDNGATRHIFRNSSYLEGIHRGTTRHFQGLAGQITMDQIGTLDGLGEAYISPEAPGNIISHSQLIRTPGVTITYDDKHPLHRWTLRVHGSIKYVFDLQENGLWECDLDEFEKEFGLMTAPYFGPSTVARNKAKYTVRDLRGAQMAYDAVEQLGHASFGTLEKILRNGTIDKVPFNLADVRRAKAIWGLHEGSVQGKTTHRTGVHAPVAPLEPVSAEQQHQTLVGDIMILDGAMYIVTTAVPMGYIQISHTPTKTIQSVYTALNAHVHSLTERGCTVDELRFDGEKSVGALRGRLAATTADELRRDLKVLFKPVRLEVAPTGVHQPIVERDQRTIKERARSYMAGLDWKVPPSVKPYLLLYVVSRLNLHPDAAYTDGICPFERLFGRKPAWDKDVQCKFGQYGQAHEYRQVTNTMEPRTTPVICLLPVGSLTGGVWVLHLTTWKAVKRNQVALLPMPDDVTQFLTDRCAVEMESLKQGNHPFQPVDSDITDDDVISPTITVPGAPDPSVPADLERAYSRPIPASPDILVDAPVQGTDIDGEDEGQHSMGQHEEDARFGQYDSPYEDSRQHGSPRLKRNSEYVPSSTPKTHRSVEFTGQDEYFAETTPRHLDTSDFGIEDVYPQDQGEIRTQHLEDIVQESSQDQQRTFRMPRKAQQRNYGDGPAKARVYMAKGNGERGSDFCFNISARKSLQEYGDRAKSVMMAELQQMLDRQVFEPAMWSEMSAEQRSGTIRSMIFLKEKFRADGTFDKLKARLVAGGHMQVRDLYNPDDTSSPTVRTASVFIIAAIAAFQKRHVVTVDIAGAYLNAEMKDRVWMILDPLMSTYMCELRPDYAKYMRKDGTLVVLLKKALYGCIESSKLWYDNLSASMVRDGFTKNRKDGCVFSKTVQGKQLCVCFHVDDLMITCEDNGAIENFLTFLQSTYKTITVNRGAVQNYLGMTFTFKEIGTVDIAMEGYVNDVIKSYEVVKKSNTPAAADLFDIHDKSAKLDRANKEIFHSRVAKLLYLAKRARPDTLLAVSFLTTRVQDPREEDMAKLDRVLSYILETRDMVLTLGITGMIQLQSYIDASFAPHLDGKSHTGAMWSLGIGAFYAASCKQKLVTKSSWEAELVAFSDQMSEVLGVQQFLLELGFEVTPIIHQDNTSTILSSAKGAGASNRTRHVNIRYFWVTQFIEDGTVKVEYTPTANMIADILTKPLQGILFRTLRDMLLGYGGECCVFGR